MKTKLIDNLKAAIKNPVNIGGIIFIVNHYFFLTFSKEMIYAVYPAAIQIVAIYFLMIGLLREIQLFRKKERRENLNG